VEVIREAGALFVADEVQPGFGRTGDAMWGFMRHGVAPDMVTLGKPMGNGQPIAGVVTRPDVVEEFGREARYFNTFGGNAVSCAAANAVLNVIQRDKLVANAKAIGAYLMAELHSLARRHEAIGDVRGAGLFVGVEIVKDRAGKGARRQDHNETCQRPAPQAGPNLRSGSKGQRAEGASSHCILEIECRSFHRNARRGFGGRSPHLIKPNTLIQAIGARQQRPSHADERASPSEWTGISALLL
jgi:4-aminobutyrate aminotransferase-like enzyme